MGTPIKQLKENKDKSPFFPWVSAKGIVEGLKTVNGEPIYGEGDIEVGGKAIIDLDELPEATVEYKNSFVRVNGNIYTLAHYRTLTGEEWKYIFNLQRSTPATINGQPGILLSSERADWNGINDSASSWSGYAFDEVPFGWTFFPCGYTLDANGNFSSKTVGRYWSSDNGGIWFGDQNGDYSGIEFFRGFQHNTSRSVRLIKESVNGAYRISQTRKVDFAQGNLQYNKVTGKYQFANHQWEVIGEDNIGGDIIDLFCYGTGNRPTQRGQEYIYDDETPFRDWGNYLELYCWEQVVNFEEVTTIVNEKLDYKQDRLDSGNNIDISILSSDATWRSHTDLTAERNARLNELVSDPDQIIKYTSTNNTYVYPYTYNYSLDGSGYNCSISNFFTGTPNKYFFRNNRNYPIKYIYQQMFYNKLYLKEVELPNSVTSIGSQAFYGCSGLTSITIPNSVTSIGNMAFQDCYSLTTVHITDLAAWCSIVFTDGSANPLCQAHHLYLNGSEVTNLVIPNSATSIEKYAFWGGASLTSITIPNSVTSIEDYAFGYCTALISITCHATTPLSINSNVFENVPRTAILYVPEESVDLYKEADVWKEFIIKPIPVNATHEWVKDQGYLTEHQDLSNYLTMDHGKIISAALNELHSKISWEDEE